VANGKNSKAGIAGKVMAFALIPAVPLLDLADKVVGKTRASVMIFLADGIKLIMKEDIIPDAVDKPLFKLAPTIVMASALGALAVLPYSTPGTSPTSTSAFLHRRVTHGSARHSDGRLGEQQ